MKYVSGIKKTTLIALFLFSITSCGGGSSGGSTPNTLDDEQGSIEGTISSLINTLLPVAHADEVIPLCSSTCSGVNCAELHLFDSGTGSFVLECQTDAVLNEYNAYDYKFNVNKKLLANKTYKIIFIKDGSHREAISYHDGAEKKELDLSLESTFKAPLAEQALEDNKDEDPSTVIEKILKDINFDQVKQALKDNKLLPDDSDDSDLDNILKIAPDEINDLLKKQYSDEKPCLNPNTSIAENSACTLKGEEYKKAKDKLDQEFYERLDSDGDGIVNAKDCAPDDKSAAIVKKLFLDEDLDGYGSSQLEKVCSPAKGIPEAYSDNDLDCNDQNSDFNLSCDEYENDADRDGMKDDEDCDPKNPDYYFYRELYLDKDEDGLGRKDVVEKICAGKELLPPNWSESPYDCDDSNPKIGEKCDSENQEFESIDFAKLYELNAERAYDAEEYGENYIAFKGLRDDVRIDDFIFRNEACEQHIGFNKAESAYRLCALSQGEKPGHYLIFKDGVSEVKITLRYLAADSKEAKSLLRSYDPENIELLSQRLVNGEDVELSIKVEKLYTLTLQVDTDNGSPAAIEIRKILYKR